VLLLDAGRRPIKVVTAVKMGVFDTTNIVANVRAAFITSIDRHLIENIFWQKFMKGVRGRPLDALFIEAVAAQGPIVQST